MIDETVQQIAKRLKVSLEEAWRIKRMHQRADVADNVQVTSEDIAEAERVRRERTLEKVRNDRA